MHSHVRHLNLTISALSTKCTDTLSQIPRFLAPLTTIRQAATDVNETQRGCWPTHPVTAGHATGVQKQSECAANADEGSDRSSFRFLGRTCAWPLFLCQTPRHQSGLSIFPATSSILTACPLLVSWPFVAFAWIGAAAGPSLTASRLSSARYRNRKSSWDFHIPGLLM